MEACGGLRQSSPSLRLLLFVTAAWLIRWADSFVLQPLPNKSIHSYSNSETDFPLNAARKLSMKEKKRRRAKRQPATPVNDNLPGATFDSKTTTEVKNESQTTSTEAVHTTTPSKEEQETMTKAQQLLAVQRESVAMLTTVRERVEELPAEEIAESLRDQGYWWCDNFLHAENLVDELQSEGLSLQSTMTQDMDNLGSGEYIQSLRGGADQYKDSPRAIEWVVSVTKHLPLHLKHSRLEEGKCISTMRTFDRNALLEATALLTGESDLSKATLTQRSFRTIATQSGDQRALSLFYFIVPDTWEPSCGGDLTFESSGEQVTPVRDRLIILESTKASLRREPWVGSDALRHASCIELHLVNKVR